MMNYLRRFHHLGINGFMAKWYNNNSKMRRIEEFKEIGIGLYVYLRK